MVKRSGPGSDADAGPARRPVSEVHKILVDHQLAIMRRMRGAQAKFAVLTGLFGVFAGAIGLMVDLPTLARM